MRVFLKLFIGLGIIFVLTGCLGENYDFTPPSIKLSTVNAQLKEANIDWDSDKHYEKKTEDIISLAKKQPPISVTPGQQESIEFDSEDFAVKELSVSLLKKNGKIKINLKDDRSFYFPKETGEYVMEVNLLTDSGSAQYVGNIVIE